MICHINWILKDPDQCGVWRAQAMFFSMQMLCHNEHIYTVFLHYEFSDVGPNYFVV